MATSLHVDLVAILVMYHDLAPLRLEPLPHATGGQLLLQGRVAFVLVRCSRSAAPQVELLELCTPLQARQRGEAAAAPQVERLELCAPLQARQRGEAAAAAQVELFEVLEVSA